MVSNSDFGTRRVSDPDNHVKETSTSSRTPAKGPSRYSSLSIATLQGARGTKGRKRNPPNGRTVVPKPLRCQHRPSFNVGSRGVRFRKLRVRRRSSQRSGHRKGGKRNSPQSLSFLFLRVIPPTLPPKSHRHRSAELAGAAFISFSSPLTSPITNPYVDGSDIIMTPFQYPVPQATIVLLVVTAHQLLSFCYRFV